MRDKDLPGDDLDMPGMKNQILSNRQAGKKRQDLLEGEQVGSSNGSIRSQEQVKGMQASIHRKDW